MRNDHAIARLCENLQASPSGFCDWDRRRLAPGFRTLEDQVLAEQTTAIHTESRQTYGSPPNSVPGANATDATASPAS